MSGHHGLLGTLWGCCLCWQLAAAYVGLAGKGNAKPGRYCLHPAYRARRAVWGEKDNPPRDGWYPTSMWRPGELVTDDCLLQVSPDAPPSRNVLVTGVYLPDTLERLPVTPAGGTWITDVLMLTKIDIGNRQVSTSL